MSLVEIPLYEIRASDVGSRAVAARDGNTFNGLLTEIDVTRSEYKLEGKPRVTARLVLKTLKKGGMLASSDTVLSELKLTALPLDYLIQIDREETP